MNKILFRGKRTDNGEWVEGFYAAFGGKDNKYHVIFTGKFIALPIGAGFTPELYYVDSETVGQFTGLVTTNETPIWEGDIARFDDANYEVRRECDTPGGYWAETGFTLKRIGWDNTESFTDTIDDFCNEICVEIIGNIHDNPELLKEEKP